MNSVKPSIVRKLPPFTSIVGIVLLVLALLIGVFLYKAKQYGEVGAGYVARQMCSCIYVQSRDETACLRDMETSLGASAKYAKIVYFPEKVIVSYAGFASAQAELQTGFGCSVRKFNGAMPNGLSLPQE